MNLPLNKQDITNIINHPVCEPDKVIDVLSSFTEIYGKFAENQAIFDSGKSYTYSNLSRDVEKLSFMLRKAGIKEGDVVAVIIDRNYNYFVSILAVLNCAAAFLPVDPSFPDERIAFFCADASVSIILSDTRDTNLIEKMKTLNVPECLKTKVTPLPKITVFNPDSVAYIIYTSGSTGMPKGVRISRKALANFISGMKGLYQISSDDRILQFSNLSFDACIEEIFGAFCSGAALYLRNSEMLLADELISFSALHQISIWDLPTAFWRQVINSGAYQDLPLHKELRIVIIGGEAVSKKDLAIWNKKRADHKLFNTYGPTETTVVALAYEIKSGYIPDTLVPIGRPLPGYRIYITDQDRNVVPLGMTGELLITGDSVALGYVNRETEQDKAFIRFQTPDNGLQWCYCTGDRVMADEDGLVLYLGRTDRQFKIRGFKVELSEIETVLSTYNGIRDNTVIVREDDNSEKRLVAYLVKEANLEIDLADLLRYIKQKLPEFMLPSAFVLLDKFPLTQNGKLDTGSLPAPGLFNTLNSEIYVEPKSNTEKKLALTWSELLNIERVGVGDNFSDLGGNSLIAAMLISRIDQDFGVRLALRTLFEKQTISEIANEIEKHNDSMTEFTTEINTIQHIDSESHTFPLSSGQKRLWFVQNFEPGNLAYHIPFDFSIRGEIDHVILEKSINELIIRHPSLRTIILTSEGVPMQKILSSYPFHLEVINLERLPDAEKNTRVAAYSHLNDIHLFNLETGPLFICKLLKISAKEYTLLMNFHHIITDGWSVSIFLEELGRIYTAHMLNKPVNLMPLPITYADFAIWQNEWLEGEGCKTQLDYWKNELKGVPDLLQLPMDFQRPKNLTYDGDEVSYILDYQLTKALQLFSKQNNTSLFVTLLSAFNTLITRYTSQEEFVIGIPIAGRIYKELESLNGMLINNFPLRISPKDKMTFPEMLEICKMKFFQAYENQQVPLDKIVEELKVSRHTNISPLFQVMFNFLNMFDKEINLSESSMQMIDKRRHIAQFDLSLHIFETNETLNCVFEYNTHLFKRERIERMAGHFNELVRSVMQDPGQNIRKIPILTPGEKTVILKKWNSTYSEFPADKCVHQLFEYQVLKTPESIAIQDHHRKITYRELNAKANKLARYLHHSGAVEGSLIGICVDRSPDLLVALLAVLKAGCTYIPLDPIYPRNRLALILEDGNPVIVLTEKKLLENLPETDAKNIFIEEDEKYLHEPEDNPNFLVTPQTVAYLIYTSGSTGKPKGVQIEHRSLVNFLVSMSKRPGIHSSDIMLAVTTISFDIAGLELFLPILYGARIVIATQETSINPELLIKEIEESQPTILQATPVTFRMLNASKWNGSKKMKILCGGEALGKELAYDLVGKCGELWNMYGPTETTVWSTVEKVVVDETDKTGYVNLGTPIDNTLIYVLNTEFQPVPVGYPGELFIGGDGLAKGYFNLPEMTGEKFLPDPFSDVAGARMYRTGDLVQQTENGKLEFLNRVDSQVKIRGFRIELGEIESALTQYRTVRDNVVIVREDTPGDKRLIAYIIKKDHQETDIADLRQFLKTKVPDYMVPSSFVFINQFPLTPNGKIDRKMLPLPEDIAPDTTKIYLEPSTDLEKKLAQIWCDVLKIKRIGTDENFFEIGGHSMIAVTLMIKIEKELGTRLPLATLFDHSNIRDMAIFLEQKEDPSRWGSLVPIRAKGNKRPLYLVHGAGLNLLLYTTIVSHLDAEQPVFGLQAKGLDGIDEPLNTIEAIAAYYISEILAFDDSGTYSLAGFSMGGQIAYEMARQLVLMDKKVSFLGVFDTVSDNITDKHLPVIQRYTQRIDRLYSQVIWTAGTFIKKPGHQKLEFFVSKWQSLIKRITKVDYVIKQEGVSAGKQTELPKYLHKVHHANYEALTNYILPTYSGKLHLFRALNQSFYIKDPVLYGWDEFVEGGVEVLNIPGEHSRIFAPPNDKIFADALQNCLNKIPGRESAQQPNDLKK